MDLDPRALEKAREAADVLLGDLPGALRESYHEFGKAFAVAYLSASGSGSAAADEYTSLRAANVARQKSWDTGNAITLTFRGNELAGEVGEACNVIKKLERERLGIRGSRDTVEHLAEELADVVICTDLIAMSEGIDLDAAVARKFNATSEKVGLPQRLLPTEVSPHG